MKQQRLIITTTIIALAAAMLFLTFVEEKQIARGDDFWSIYFTKPLDVSDNDFVIDHHGDTAYHFTYAITSLDTKNFEESITLNANEKIVITSPEIEPDQPFTITVTDKDGHQKSIYRK